MKQYKIQIFNALVEKIEVFKPTHFYKCAQQTVALLIRVQKKKWIRSLEDFMLLEEDDHIDISIGNDIK